MAPRHYVVLLLGLSLSGVAHADWEVTHAPPGKTDPRVSEALYGALMKTPDDRGALSRLLAHAGKAERVKLAERCEKSAPSVACGHLYREGGDSTHALAAYAKVGAHRAAGSLLDKLGRTDEALHELELAHASTPADADELLALYGRAHVPALEARRIAAETLATQILNEHPPIDDARKRRVAEALASVGDGARAAHLYGELAAHGDPVVRVPLYFRQAELASDGEAYDDAVAALEHATALLPPRDGRKRDALERQVDIERKRDRLPQLAAKLSASTNRDAPTEALLGRVLDETGDAAAARQHLQRAIALDPRDIAARRLLVRLYARTGDEDGAIAELRKLVAATGREERTVLELAERLHAQPNANAVKEAVAIATQLGHAHPDAGTHATLAALYQKWGDSARALAEAQLLVKLEPKDPEYLIALGELYDQKGDKVGARKIWARIAPPPNPSLENRLRLADVLAEHDEGGEALAILERASHDHPDDLVVTRKLADVLDRLRRDVEAELIYRRLLEGAVGRNDASAVRDLGVRWLELGVRRGSLNVALPKFASMLEAAKGSTGTELALLVARGRVRERNFVEADKLLGAAAARAQPNERGRLLEARAELLTAQGGPRANEALALLVEAAKVDDMRAPLLYGKASARAAALYRDDEALRYAEKAVALAPTDPDAQERLGSLLEVRDPVRALAAYDRALELDGGRDRLRLRAAELALRRGDDDSAAKRYRELLGRARDEQALEEAARRAVVVHELTGRLGILEREVAPRASASEVGGGPGNGGQDTLRRLLIEIDRRYVPQLAARAQAGDKSARTELDRVAQHALGPLLDGIVEGDRDERRAAIQLVGQLGSRGAAPLLLRLAAGEAARRGSEAPSIELRTAAAEAAIALASDADVPRLAKLASDPEQRVRLAAIVALGRLANVHDARTTEALEHALADSHERVVAAACLGLPADAPLHAPLSLVAIAFDATRPLAERACGVQLADRLRTRSDAALGKALLEQAREGTLTTGTARALVESGEPPAMQRGLLALLIDPALHRTAARVPASLTVDLSGALAAREADVEGVRDLVGVRAAFLALLGGPDKSTAAAALADLLLDRPLLPRLLGAHDADADVTRAALIDQAAPQLGRLAQDKAPALRLLALALASERAATLPAIDAAANRDIDRRAALLALAGPHALVLGDSDAAALATAMQRALAASDWRERRAALACLRRQPSLRQRFAKEALRLRDDDNGLVASLAATIANLPNQDASQHKSGSAD